MTATPAAPIGLLAFRHYRVLPGLIVVEERERGGNLDLTRVALNDATVSDLERAVALQRVLVERVRGTPDEDHEVAMRDALAALLAIRRSQGVPATGPAWDRAFDRRPRPGSRPPTHTPTTLPSRHRGLAR